MPTKRVTVSLEPELAYWLEAAAKVQSCSVSEVIRQTLREYATEHPDNYSRKKTANKSSEAVWLKAQHTDGLYKD
ncbi:ribbon-helix-helix domain-containing protein [Yoonia sp. I 8.24]|uniref:ribbon-helix-helix domain-containing protein n=1 Tax=Yoonia sp. I 8.24 TaxID=1537229 RepID=UPI001EDDF334|nr:CopG family transcriptional regulator [Yoonia sp. I 8.24]